MFRFYSVIIALLLALSFTGSRAVLAEELSPEDVMAQVLLDQNAAEDVKLANARVLLASSAGCEQLVKILNGQNYIKAKQIICDVISKKNPEGLFVTNQGVPEIFIEPLFKCLYVNDQQLSAKAALALAECFPQKVLARLAGTAISTDAKLDHRLAAISAIENISGREALLNLAELLKDEHPEIRDRAVQAICQRLMLDPADFDAEYFTLVELPNIRWMSDVEYLMFQTRNLSRKNKHLTFEGKTLQDQMIFWQQKYLRSETDRFNSLTPENKLVMLKDKLDVSQEHAVRQWAARQLVTWSNSANAREGEVARELIGLLGDLITDDQDYIRAAVAEVLGVLGYKTGTEPLVEQLLVNLENEQSPVCLRAVLNTLGQLQYIPAFEKCLKVWENCKDNDIAAAAISAAGKMSAKISVEETSRIELLINSITNNYAKAADSQVLKIAIFQAIKKIVEDEKWHKIAAEPFGKLISGGLADKLPDVRSLAVYSHIALMKEQSPVKLLANNMLDDPEASVRFAVIEAIDSYGSASYLDMLKARLGLEQSSDVKARLQETIVSILTSMQVDEIYNWILNLENTSDAIRILKMQAVSILSEKVSTLKAETGSVDPKYEVAILEYTVSDFLRKQQYEQAAQAMVDLLNAKISLEKRVEICHTAFDLIFDNAIDVAKRSKVVDILQVAITAAIDIDDAILQVFLERYQQIANDSLPNILIKAKVVKQYIFSSSYDSAKGLASSEYWSSQGIELASLVIDYIISGELTLDQQMVVLIKSLDARLADMPEDKDARIQYLKKFKESLNTASAQ